MTGFVATPPAPASPELSTVEADGWFPATDVNAVRDAVRIGEGIVTHARLVAAIEGAIVTAMGLLADWQAAFVEAGVAALDAIPNDKQINGRARAVILWERAIRYFAAAEVADLHRDVSATNEGQIRADNERQTADDYRRLAGYAISDLLSIGAIAKVARNRVELI